MRGALNRIRHIEFVATRSQSDSMRLHHISRTWLGISRRSLRVIEHSAIRHPANSKADPVLQIDIDQSVGFVYGEGAHTSRPCGEVSDRSLHPSDDVIDRQGVIPYIAIIDI